jgi:hypothetical protein
VPAPELYAAVFTTAPIILLALGGSIVFGPAPDRGRHVRRRHTWELVNDAFAVLTIFVGAAVSLLVLAGPVPDPLWTRLLAGGAAGMALGLTVLHVAADILIQYRAQPPEV